MNLRPASFSLIDPFEMFCIPIFHDSTFHSAIFNGQDAKGWQAAAPRQGNAAGVKHSHSAGIIPNRDMGMPKQDHIRPLFLRPIADGIGIPMDSLLMSVGQ